MANRTFEVRNAGVGPRGWTPGVCTSNYFRAIAQGVFRDAWVPEVIWVVEVNDTTINAGTGLTQTTTLTVSATGFAAGRATITFSGGNLSSPVEVTADAEIGDANTDLAAAIEAAIQAERGASLSDTVAGETVASNVVTVVMVAGIPPVTVAVAFESAQAIDLVWSGTLQNGSYTVRLASADLGDPVDVTVVRVGGSPAAITDMIVSMEAAAEALIATTLADVLVSADDDATDTNAFLFETAIAAVTMSDVSVKPMSFTTTFGGTEANGNYDLTFDHASLPGPVTVRVVRAGGVPATNDDLAAQMQTDVEAHSALSALIDAAASSATAAVNTFITYAGIEGLTITSSAPAGATLVVDDTSPTLAINDATPAGTTIDVAHSAAIDLNTLAGELGFPANSWRGPVTAEVIEAFSASRTLTMGDAADPDAVLGSTPLALDATGQLGSVAADAEYMARPEAAWEPTVTIAMGTTMTTSIGRVELRVTCAPLTAVGDPTP